MGAGTAMMLGGPTILTALPNGNRPLTNSLNVGILGVGARGLQLLTAIQDKVTDMDVTAVCEVLDSRLAAGRQLTGGKVKAYKDYRALLDDKTIDAVFIATPLHLHFQMAMDAISAGKHVYCEKTMAYDIDQTLELCAAASRSTTVFQVGYQERYNPLFQQVKKLVTSGSCGKITYVDCQWNRNGNWRKSIPDAQLEKHVNWRMYKAFSGGLMAELCSHQIDLVNWCLASRPLSVVGMGGIDYWKDGRETYDNVTAIYGYEGGVKARFTALTTNASEGFRMKLYGTKATLEINRENDQQGFLFPEQYPDENPLNVDGLTGATETERWPAGGIPIIVDDPHGLADSTANAIREFKNCIWRKTTPVSNAKTAALGSIAVHMANGAMRDECTHYWKDAYNPFVS